MAKDAEVKAGAERTRMILDAVRAKRSIKVHELEKMLGVSGMTIRRCLNELAAEGLIKRIHGGAEAAPSEDGEDGFRTRLRLNPEIKARLAAGAVQCVGNNDSVFLDSGTTCFAVAQQLAFSGKRCTVITDSILVLKELSGISTLDAILLGGSLSDDGVTLDGPMTVESAGKVSVDLCFFSADGFTDEQMGGRRLTGALTKKIIIQRADRSVFVCDSEKYGRPHCFRSCGWAEVDLFLTDSGLPKPVREAIAMKEVEVRTL